MERTQPGCVQCDCDGQPFRQVLQRNGAGEGQADTQVTLREAHAYGHAFRQIVQRDHENEQPDPVHALAPMGRKDRRGHARAA